MFATLSSPPPPHVLSLPTPPRALFSRSSSFAHPSSHHMPQQRISDQQKLDSSVEQRSPPSSSPPSSPASYAQRYFSRIRNPTSRVADRASRDIRRNAFLNRVKQGREDSRFNAREDGMLWMEYITAKRRFEEEMGRSAPQIDNVEDEAMDTQADGEPHESMRVDERNWDEQAALEEYLEQEEGYEAFLEELQQQTDSNHKQNDRGEEEDYDSIFADLASHHDSYSISNDQMDMSHG